MSDRTPGREQLALPFDAPDVTGPPDAPDAAGPPEAAGTSHAADVPGGDAGDLRRLRALGVLDAAEAHVADAICRLVGEDRGEVRLAVALAVRAPRLGHVCLDLDRLAEHGLDVEGDPAVDVPLPAPRVWREALEASPAVRVAESSPSPDDGARSAATAPLVLDAGRLYLDRYWRYEDRLAARLRRLAARAADDRGQAEVTAALDRLFPPGDDDPDLQRRAAEVAATRALTVLSGGPGTGKTTTVVRLLATLLETGPTTPPRVALAAPTGKAAARMGEAVAEALAAPWLALEPTTRAALHDVPAMTLHRLLGFRPDTPTRFRHHAGRPLPYDVVVVDEASMVSLPMAARLADALREGARLVLVGDRDQLASVEAGAVLSELCSPEAARGALEACVVQLTRFHRFGPHSGIGAVARAVQRIDDDAEEVIDLLEGRRTETGRGPAYEDVALLDPVPEQPLPPDVERGVVDAYRAVVETALGGGEPARVLAAFERQRVLCALRAGPQGVEAVNVHLEQQLSTHGYQVHERFPVGRPVMVTQNDYAVRLFNGDVGVVVPDPQDATRRVVAFPGTDGGVRLLAPGRLPPHETVWAMSVHKSQGSQFDRVVVLLPDQPSPILSRELVYTGVTRAREHVTVIARRDLLAAALVRSLPRASGLGERLSTIGQA
jgi:exodeoxyribonuclease V alpha subunit